MSTAAPLQSLQSLQRALAEATPRSVATEIAVLAAALGVAYLLVWLLNGRRRLAGGIWFGQRLYDGVLFPLLALGVGLVARWGLKEVVPVGLLRLAVPILASLVIIRLTVQVLHRAYPESTMVRRLERTVSWFVWIGLVLWLSGVLPLMNEELESVFWRVGGVNLSLASILQGMISAIAVLLLVLWLSSAVESRLLKGAVGAEMSARKIAANATRVLLMLVGVVVALSAAGIPMSALSVMGGAVGVGIGLGLQKLASNYVSGFVILAERSLRIGDMVKVDTFEGHITDIKSRYTVIRALSGRESIVPNELMITQRIENASLADRQVALSTVVQVAYGTDLSALIPRIVAMAMTVPRVLAWPAPSVQLSAFADSGLELTLLFWISDPENGQGNVRSDVNLGLLRTLDESGVTIPYPQRVLQVVNSGGEVELPSPPREA